MNWSHSLRRLSLSLSLRPAPGVPSTPSTAGFGGRSEARPVNSGCPGGGLCNPQAQGLTSHGTNFNLWETKDRREPANKLPLLSFLQWTVLSMVPPCNPSRIIPCPQATSCVLYGGAPLSKYPPVQLRPGEES